MRIMERLAPRTGHWLRRALTVSSRFCLFAGLVATLASTLASTPAWADTLWSADSEIADIDAIINDLNISGKVLGGSDADPGAWPSVVTLVRAGPFTLQSSLFCGGTVVAERWVMTAAHCLYDTYGRVEEPSTIRVVTGVYDLVDDAAAEEVVVTNIIIHPDYDNSMELPPDDIALLELATAVDAPANDLFAADSSDYTGQYGTIVGWGAMHYDSITYQASDFPTTLQQAQVPLVSREQCNALNSYQDMIGPRQLCAGYPEGGVDTCAGDSGGPLYIVQDGRPVQIGITSFGNGCGLENYYGIYTNVSRFIPWLSNYLSVPEQSSDLLTAWELENSDVKSANGSHSNSGLFGGGSSALLLLFLAFRLPMDRRVRGALLAMLTLGLAACSAQAIEGSSEESRLKRLDEVQLATVGERAGLAGLTLGSSRETVMEQLAADYWQEPVCVTDKTAMRGTGRLFMIERCSTAARNEPGLLNHAVKNLQLLMIDLKLVRLDVSVQSTASPAVSNSDVMADLQTALSSRFGREIQSMQWVQGDDLVRLDANAGPQIQFIDGRLRYQLPSLYE